LNIWLFKNDYRTTLTFILLYMTVSIRVSSVALSTSTWRWMIYYLAISVLATGSWARILTSVQPTSPIRWTIGVNSAFRSTALVRITEVLRKALTSSSAILFSANGVRSTRARIARLNVLTRRFLLSNITLREWISLVALNAYTNGCMTYNTAFGVMAAGSWTWVATFLINTSQRGGTFGVANAFRSAIWWGADKFRQARAWWRISDGSTIRIWSTWWWITRIDLVSWRCFN